MARLIYEFFRPRVSLTVAAPIGVIAQDDKGVVYRAVRSVELADKEEQAFYRLEDREHFMNADFLSRLELVDPASGEHAALDGSDPRVLDVLRDRGTHHFIYSPVEERSGSADKVAAGEVERLEDKDARRELVLRFADEVTRAVLEAI